jgi:DNA-binding GntR family transcriptional regulator
MNLVKIDGVVYDALVTALEETAEVVEGENSGTAIYRERAIRDIKGIKYAHSITFSPNEQAPEMFDELFSYLFDSVRESVMLEVVHGQKTINYEAVYSTGTRAVNYITKKNAIDSEEEENEFIGWNEVTVEFRSRETVINAGV